MTTPIKKRAGSGHVTALALGLVSLLVWAGLVLGSNFALHPVLSACGIAWLVTVGLPTSVGVAVAAMVWGRSEFTTGLSGFVVCAGLLGLVLQFGAARVWRVMQGTCGLRVRVLAGPWALIAATLSMGGLWVVRREAPPQAGLVDGHAHLFGDEGWPPIHNKSCGLSPAQKANPTYGLLMRLLGLPKEQREGLNERYVEALVRQAREARQRLGSLRVVLLAQDCRYTEAGEPDWEHSTVYVPNHHLFRIVERYPDLFIACPSLNPRRKDWEAELEYCLSQGAHVLKIHPPTQDVNPGDPRFRAFFRRCAEQGMGVMVHTGAEHSAPISSSTLGDPRLLKLALEEGCLVVAAHSGTKAFFDPPREDHFGDLAGLMMEHPRLYGDTAVLGSQFRWRCVPTIVETPQVLPRVVHASDWPFPSNAMVFWHRLHPFHLVALMAEPNLFVRDLRIKQALGLPIDGFTRMGGLLSSRASKERGSR